MDTTTDKSPKSPKNHQGIFQKHIIWHDASGILLVYLEEPITKAGVFRKQDCGEWVYNMYDFLKDGSYKSVSGKQTCLSDFVNSTCGKISNSAYHKAKLVCSLFWSDSDHNCIGVQDGSLCSHASHDWKDVDFFWNDLQPQTPAKRSRPTEVFEREDAFDLDLSDISDSLPPCKKSRTSAEDTLNKIWVNNQLDELADSDQGFITIYKKVLQDYYSLAAKGTDRILRWFQVLKQSTKTGVVPRADSVADAVYRGYLLSTLRQTLGLTLNKTGWKAYIAQHKDCLPAIETITYQIKLYELVEVKGYTRLLFCDDITNRPVVSKLYMVLHKATSELASKWKL